MRRRIAVNVPNDHIVNALRNQPRNTGADLLLAGAQDGKARASDTSANAGFADGRGGQGVGETLRIDLTGKPGAFKVTIGFSTANPGDEDQCGLTRYLAQQEHRRTQ